MNLPRNGKHDHTVLCLLILERIWECSCNTKAIIIHKAKLLAMMCELSCLRRKRLSSQKKEICPILKCCLSPANSRIHKSCFCSAGPTCGAGRYVHSWARASSVPFTTEAAALPQPQFSSIVLLYFSAIFHTSFLAGAHLIISGLWFFFFFWFLLNLLVSDFFLPIAFYLSTNHTLTIGIGFHIYSLYA